MRNRNNLFISVYVLSIILLSSLFLQNVIYVRNKANETISHVLSKEEISEIVETLSKKGITPHEALYWEEK